MAIDLLANHSMGQKAGQSSPAQVANQRQDSLQGTLKALNLKVGDSVEALVRSVTPVDSQLRSRLSQLVLPSSQGNEAASARTATSTGIQMRGDGSPTANLMSLLQTPTLKLLEVIVKNQSLMVFTDQPIKTGQNINLQLQPQGFLLKAPNSSASPLSSTTQMSSTTQSGIPTLNTQQQQTLNQLMRTLLPVFQDPNNQAQKAVMDTLQVALTLSLKSSSPTVTQLQRQLPSNIGDSLRQLATQLRSATTLAQPETLQSTLKQNGQSMEAHWSRILNNGSSTKLPDNFPGSLPGHAPNSTTKTASSLLQQAATLGESKLPASDLKAGLTNLLQQLQLSLTGKTTNLQVSQWLNQLPSSASSPQLLAELLKKIIHKTAQDNSKSGPGNTSIRPETLLTQLQQQVQLALAKILFDQLRSLQQNQPSADQPSPVPSWQLEIPVRFGAELYPFHFHIEQKKEGSSKDQGQKPSEQEKKWMVKMTFELPNAGKLHAHISVLQDQVSSTLWVENPVAFKLAQQQLKLLRQRLEKDGCIVNSLECLKGKPVTEKTQVQYSLVDVRT